MKKIYFIFLLGILIVSCQNKTDNSDYKKLTLLDSLIEKDELPMAVDSLKMMGTETLSRTNLAYYQLLDTRLKDKTYYNFTSDSTINNVENFFHGHKNKYPRLCALSLMYQGIVRYRMGKIDSTVLIPFKKAIDVFNVTLPLDIKNLYLCNLYSGLVHDSHNNVGDAYFYLKEAVKYAKMNNDTTQLFYMFSELAWNRLKAYEPKNAKKYIDLSKNYASTEEDTKTLTYLLFAYLSYNKEYAKSIELEEKYIDLTDPNDSSILCKIYYKMSNNYEALKDYKNAYYYAQLSNSYLKDTLNYADFLLYKHLGDLAIKANELESSVYAYQKAYLRQNESIIRQTDKKVLEIEKKYDYTRVENEKLIAQKRSQIYLFISIFILLLFCIGILFANRNRIKEKNKRLLLENEKIKLENNEKNLQQITFQKAFINSVYALIIDNNNEQMNVFYKLRIHNDIKKEEKLCKLIDELEKDYKSRMKKISTLLLDDYTFIQLTNLNKQQADLLSESDKILYTLIKCNLDYNQIATLLGSSYDSIRTRKKNIANKLAGKKTKINPKNRLIRPKI